MVQYVVKKAHFEAIRCHIYKALLHSPSSTLTEGLEEKTIALPRVFASAYDICSFSTHKLNIEYNVKE